jgi:SAM-dependent methyltransferase
MGTEGLIPTTDSFGTALADIVRCRNCGHMQLEHMPNEAELSDAYREAESDEYVEEEAGQRATARAILDRIESHVEVGALVDLGCWVGFLLDEARARGWETVGVEPSEFAASYAAGQLGLDVRNEDLFDAELPQERFDAVFMGDVIEHLPAAGEAVERSKRLLVPGGVLAMALPDAGSRVARSLGRRWWSVIPTHVHYFTRRSMAQFLAGHGFEVLEMRTAPKAFSVRYYLGRLSGYREGFGRALVGSAERLGVADRLWAPDFRDRMLVIARGAR